MEIWLLNWGKVMVIGVFNAMLIAVCDAFCSLALMLRGFNVKESFRCSGFFISLCLLLYELWISHLFISILLLCSFQFTFYNDYFSKWSFGYWKFQITDFPEMCFKDFYQNLNFYMNLNVFWRILMLFREI